MIQNPSIRFYLNEYKARGKKFPIYLRITLERKKAEITTGYFLELKDWDAEVHRAKKNFEINQKLASIENEVYEIVHRLEKEKKLLTANAIKNYLTKKDKLDLTIVEFYQKHLDRLKDAGEVEEVTVAMYGYTKKYLQAFLRDIKKVEDIRIENIDFRFLSDFDLFLLNQKIKAYDKNETPKYLERNTVNKHHSRLRTILIRAIKEGHISKNPYVDFKLKKNPTQRTFLNQEELDKLIQHDLGNNESLKKVRDIFIFSVYTGLRFEDAQQLTTDSIIKDSKENYILQLTQDKTNEQLSIPLLRPAVSIIERYKACAERKIFKKVLPKITNQKLNAYLKVIADLVGIEKTLTHHMARHTCATTILLSNEVPIEAVSKWLGHTNIKTTQIYAKITPDYLQQLAKKVGDKLPRLEPSLHSNEK